MNNSILELSHKSNLCKDDIILLDCIAIELRHKYVDFISELNYKYKAEIDWTLTDLSSRNTAVCSIFENLCKLELIKRLHEQRKIKSIKTDNYFLCKSISKNFNDKLNIINQSNAFLRFFKILTYNLKKFIVLFYSYLSRFLISKIVGVNSPLDNKKSIIILESIIYKNSLENEEFKDRHYPGLFNNITEFEKSSIFILPYYYGIYNFYKLFRKLKKNKTYFLIPENFLKFSDYYYSILSFSRLLKNIKNIKNIKFNGYDVTDLVLESYLENIVSIGSSEGLIRNKLINRLKVSHVKIKRFIQWYENQPINKGTVVSLKTNYPKTKIIGHIGSYFSPNLIGICPSNQELDCDLLPDEVAVIGKNIDSLIKEYCSNLKTVLSPAYRFQHLLKTKPKNNSSKYNILIILPIFKVDYSMILKLFGFAKSKIKAHNLLIKIHPGSNKNIVTKKLIENDLINFVTYKNIEETLTCADLVITSASSSALESFFSGKPTLLISNGSGILKNPIPCNILSNLYSVCYNVDDIINKIKYFMNLSNQQLIDLQKFSNFNITDYIEPNTLSATQRFLGLDKSVVKNE